VTNTNIKIFNRLNKFFYDFNEFQNFFNTMQLLLVFLKIYETNEERFELQSDLCTTATLGTQKKWPLFKG
jgi:hypothetical protein